MTSLSDSVAALAGVGPKRVQALKSLDIENINDLLTYFPFRYEDLQAKDPAELTDQAKVTLKGTVAGAAVLTRFGRKKNRLNFRLLLDEHTVIPVTFFNQPWLKDKLEVGNEIVVYGRFDAKRQSLAGMKILASADSGMGSIYPANKEIRQGTIQKLVESATLGDLALTVAKCRRQTRGCDPVDLRVTGTGTGLHAAGTAAVTAAHPRTGRNHVVGFGIDGRAAGHVGALDVAQLRNLGRITQLHRRQRHLRATALASGTATALHLLKRRLPIR